MLLLFLSTAFAVPPLVQAADLAAPGMEVWWREGELLAGEPTQPGRPGLRPLSDLAPLALPVDLTGWTPLGDPCVPGATDHAMLDTVAVDADVIGDKEAPVIRLRAGQRLVASAALGRPAHICALRVVQADALPGLEIIVVWRPLEEDANLRGLVVYHIPDAAR